jgi:hypothetical protein
MSKTSHEEAMKLVEKIPISLMEKQVSQSRYLYTRMKACKLRPSTPLTMLATNKNSFNARKKLK